MQNISSLKKTARMAGLLYLLIVFTAPYAHFYVPKKIFVRDDADATTTNILNNEFLFRTCIAVNLVEGIIFLLLALTLYKLFREVNNHLARLMVAFVTVQLPVVFVLAAIKTTALMMAKGSITPALLPGNTAELTMLFLRINEYGMMALEMLWGLWLLPFGMLVYKSRFMPRILAILLIMAGAGYIADSFTYILFPQYQGYTRIAALILPAAGHLSMILWLLIKGVREHISIPVFSEHPLTSIHHKAVADGT